MSVEIDRETSGMESNSALGRCRLNVRIASEGGPPLQGLRGTTRPSALAVLKLITISYLTDACTGKSAGFSPLRMRST